MFEHVNRFGIWGAAAYGEFFPLESLPVRSPVISDHQKSFYQMTPTVMLIILLVLLYLTYIPLCRRGELHHDDCVRISWIRDGLSGWRCLWSFSGWWSSEWTWSSTSKDEMFMGNYIQSIIILFDFLGKVIVILINCNHHHYKDVQFDRPFADDFDVDHSDNHHGWSSWSL